MLDFSFNNFTRDKSFSENFFYKIIKKAVIELGLEDKNLGISLNLVGERKIREQSKKYLGKDKPTDVLSFPLSKVSPDDKGLVLIGDIFICPTFAKRRAKRENVNIKSNMAWLTVHGLLHLLGYDHESSEKDRKEMEKLENKILT
ncbi:MAG: rRNA maturation RNase YbeY [Candidatus Yanofskybacteria bacterium]|nr:rRNA maturation RNase YbeY [Candidatus Yanofskybacteria bacterium]